MSTCTNSEWDGVVLSELEYASLDMSLKQALKEMEEQRREQHRASMVVFRQNRKERQKRREAELVRLEREMELVVKIVRATASCYSTTEKNATTTPMDALRNLVVERELLQTENRALHEEVQRHKKFHQIVVEASQAGTSTLEILPQTGWTVHFARGGPPFQFYPLTREDYNDGLYRFDANISSGAMSLSKVGNFFGWEVHRAPLVYSSLDNKSIVARARLAKHVHCSLDVLLMISLRRDKDISATILTPIGWSIHQRHNVSTQVLQEFDAHAAVIAHNIPGPDKHLRYVYLVRREQWLLPDGRRKLTLSVTITDPNSSRHDRDADPFKDQVEWATEGGIHLTVTEVDETSMYIVCDRYAGCKSKAHAEYAMLHWIQYANWWEQTVAPASLLL